MHLKLEARTTTIISFAEKAVAQSNQAKANLNIEIKVH